MSAALSDSSMMASLVFTGPSALQLQELPLPVAEPGEVVIDVAGCGVCGSELHGIRQVGFRKPPLVMGHEFSGTTADGHRVTVNPLISCGSCDLCRRGSLHLCRQRAILGIHRPGAFAGQVAVPASAVHELPDSLDLTTACMVEPLANAVHAVRLSDPDRGARIGVIGAGTIGLCVLLVALQHSADVHVADLSDDRLAFADRLGAASVGRELTGEFDVVIDAVGAAATHAASIDLLRPGGVAVWIGLLSAESAFDGQEIVRSEKRVIGSYCYLPEDFIEALGLADQVPSDWIVSYPLSEGVQVFSELMNGRHDIVKAVLHP